MHLRKFADICAWVGLSLFLTGGVFFSLPSTANEKKLFFELSDFGLFFVPICLLVFLSKARFEDFSFGIALFQIKTRLEKNPLWIHRAFWIVLTILSFSHVLGSWNRYLSFNSGWDLAIYANACANGLHSSLKGHTTLLADHFEPLLFLFVPFCKNVDPAMFLLFAQVMMLLVGGVGMRRLALSTQYTPLQSSLWGIGYILFSKNVSALYLDFHSVSFALAFIPWLLSFIVQDRFVAFLTLGILFCGVKETESLIFAGLGSIWIAKEKPKRGLFVAVLGIAFFIFVIVYVFPIMRNGGSAYFAKYYGHFGTNFAEFAMSPITKPSVWVETLFQWKKLKYLALICIPFLFVHITKPLLMIPVLPPAAVALLSNDGQLISGKFHYEVEIFCILFATLVFLNREKKWFKAVVVVLLCFFSGKGLLFYSRFYNPSDSQIELHRHLQKIADDYTTKHIASVDRIVANLSRVRNLTLLDSYENADVVVIAYPIGDRLWSQTLSHIENHIIPTLLKHNYTVQYPLATDLTFRVFLRSAKDQ